MPKSYGDNNVNPVEPQGETEVPEPVEQEEEYWIRESRAQYKAFDIIQYASKITEFFWAHSADSDYDRMLCVAWLDILWEELDGSTGEYTELCDELDEGGITFAWYRRVDEDTPQNWYRQKGKNKKTTAGDTERNKT